jgi:hypothetical protein
MAHPVNTNIGVYIKIPRHLNLIITLSNLADDVHPNLKLYNVCKEK